MLNDLKYKQIVNEWFARLEKGYALPPYTEDEMRVLESIIKVPQQLNEIEFDDLIQKKFPNGVPAAVGKYPLPNGRTFEINITNSADKKVFESLFEVKPGAGVGNGEVSLYWLFGGPPVVSEERTGASADLTINGYGCEVKSYSKHDSKITLGKFKELRESRQIISRVFGILNLTKSFDKNSETSFYTETKFNAADLKEGFDTLLELKRSVFDNPDLQQILSQVSAFRQMKKEIEWVLKTFEGKDTSEDLAKACMAKVLSEKLRIKPGFGGYMINCLKGNPTDIKAFYIPTNAEEILRETDFATLNSNTVVNSGEIAINYSKLF